MTIQQGWLRESTKQDGVELAVGGDWTIVGAATLEALVRALSPGPARSARFDLSKVSALDTAGVWLLRRAAKAYEAAGAEVEFTGAAERFAPLFALVEENEDSRPPKAARRNSVLAMVERVGETTVEVWGEAVALVNFIGMATLAGLRTVRRPRRFRLVSLVNQVERTGLDAIPIIGLMAFLIGIVLAFQGATILRKYGGEIFTIDMLAVTILRELGVLLTAIMVAGRSGSAFTAEIGTMKVNEEIAAMQALGLDPMEVLVLPRINALMITLPILTFFADVVAMVGGAAMAIVSLDLTPAQFIGRLEIAATPTMFMVGMVKAPVFAYLIATVGCYEGLRVSGGAESVGRLTTRSVVQSIFLVIIADAVFSIMFSSMGI